MDAEVVSFTRIAMEVVSILLKNGFGYYRIVTIFAMLEVAGWRDSIKPGHSNLGSSSNYSLIVLLRKVLLEDS